MTATAQTIESIRATGGLKGIDIANMVHVNKATVSRWKSGKAVPGSNIQLVISDLKYVVDSLADFYQPDEIRQWLFSRNKQLDGERAIDLIYDNRTEQVLDVIENLSSLSYL